MEHAAAPAGRPSAPPLSDLSLVDLAMLHDPHAAFAALPTRVGGRRFAPGRYTFVPPQDILPRGPAAPHPSFDRPG